MVTTYRIETGYNSAHQNDEVWAALKQVVSTIQLNPALIEAEVLRLEPTANKALVEEIAALYKPPVHDLTIKVLEVDDQAVLQSASGGGVYRDAKESCRRAFCRLVIEEMHKRKMEISLIVV